MFRIGKFSGRLSLQDRVRGHRVSFTNENLDHATAHLRGDGHLVRFDGPGSFEIRRRRPKGTVRLRRIPGRRGQDQNQ